MVEPGLPMNSASSCRDLCKRYERHARMYTNTTAMFAHNPMKLQDAPVVDVGRGMQFRGDALMLKMAEGAPPLTSE